MGSFAASSSLLKEGEVWITPLLSPKASWDDWQEHVLLGTNAAPRENKITFSKRSQWGHFVVTSSSAHHLWLRKRQRGGVTFSFPNRTQDMLRNCFYIWWLTLNSKLGKQERLIKINILRLESHLWEPDHEGAQLKPHTLTYISYILGYSGGRWTINIWFYVLPLPTTLCAGQHLVGFLLGQTVQVFLGWATLSSAIMPHEIIGVFHFNGFPEFNNFFSTCSPISFGHLLPANNISGVYILCYPNSPLHQKSFKLYFPNVIKFNDAQELFLIL